MKILNQWVRTDYKTNFRRTKKARVSYLYTKYVDETGVEAIKGEPISTEEAAVFAAKFGGF
jgi:hypothetical protein